MFGLYLKDVKLLTVIEKQKIDFFLQVCVILGREDVNRPPREQCLRGTRHPFFDMVFSVRVPVPVSAVL
jgi:hypothetical protein